MIDRDIVLEKLLAEILKANAPLPVTDQALDFLKLLRGQALAKALKYGKCSFIPGFSHRISTLDAL